VNGALRLVPSGGSADLAAPTVNLRVLGSDAPSLFAVPGPERVELDWNQLPTPIGAGTVRAAVYRGRSASKLALYRNITGTVFVDHPTPGHTYYYAVAPRLSSGTLGDRSPAVAAMAWPKYGAGMYHRFGNGARFAASVLVRAGHPYSLKILGRHGVPASHVSAVSLNVTAASPTAGTNIYVYPAGGRRPAAADLAVRRGDTRSNFVLAQVGKSGRILLATSHGSVRLTVDASGYFSGSGLSSRYGMGAALHMSGEPVTALDTKGWHLGPVPAGYAARGGVEFRSDIAPHVTSLLVEVTAYGSKGSGSISAFADGRRAPSATVLTYRPNVTTSSAAIVNFAGSYSNGESITSTWFLNRGKKSVHLHVAVLGYFDDNTLDYGQRYIPTAPVHLYGGTLHAGTSRTVAPGRHGNYWTSAFNLKIAASKPSAASTISVRPIGFGSAPAKGQLHTSKKVDVVSSTISVSGTSNRFAVRNSAGSVRVDVWSFGRFDCYPFPAARGYASTAGPAAASTTAGPLRRIA
jgi:hypothetical protein